MFDAVSGVVKTTIPLPGKPEFAVVDVKAGRIYNNIEDTSTVVAIDTTTHKIVNTWPIAPGEEASGWRSTWRTIASSSAARTA